MILFTDREFGEVPPTKNEIDINVWNGILGIIEFSIANNYFAKNFPETCPDGLGITGVNTTLFYDRIKACIPQIEEPIARKVTLIPSETSTFSVLDLIEFCYQNINDSETIGNFHVFFNHYHLKFNLTNNNKLHFQEEINQLFKRNGIAYKLEDSGKIIRTIPKILQPITSKIIATKDSKLNELINEARQFIQLPTTIDRTRALEKIWDAFERVKTIYSDNKKLSAEQLISTAAKGNTLFESYLKSEIFILTEIGNKFQIRHFESDKQPITNLEQIDYLFFRMFSLINLFVTNLE